MLIAGNTREELAELARSDGSVAKLNAMLDELEVFEGVAFIVRDRKRGGYTYRVEFQVREGADLKIVREAALVHESGTWVVT